MYDHTIFLDRIMHDNSLIREVCHCNLLEHDNEVSEQDGTHEETTPIQVPQVHKKDVKEEDTLIPYFSFL